MNNSERAIALRAILSSEVTPYEKECMHDLQDSYVNNIIWKVGALEVNKKNFKMLQAVKYMLETLEY